MADIYLVPRGTVYVIICRQDILASGMLKRTGNQCQKISEFDPKLPDIAILHKPSC